MDTDTDTDTDAEWAATWMRMTHSWPRARTARRWEVAFRPTIRKHPLHSIPMMFLLHSLLQILEQPCIALLPTRTRVTMTTMLVMHENASVAAGSVEEIIAVEEPEQHLHLREGARPPIQGCTKMRIGQWRQTTTTTTTRMMQTHCSPFWMSLACPTSSVISNTRRRKWIFLKQRPIAKRKNMTMTKKAGIGTNTGRRNWRNELKR